MGRLFFSSIRKGKEKQGDRKGKRNERRPIKGKEQVQRMFRGFDNGED